MTFVDGHLRSTIARLLRWSRASQDAPGEQISHPVPAGSGVEGKAGWTSFCCRERMQPRGLCVLLFLHIQRDHGCYRMDTGAEKEPEKPIAGVGRGLHGPTDVLLLLRPLQVLLSCIVPSCLPLLVLCPHDDAALGGYDICT